jgi:phosphinothricin acetyltransferase
MNAHHAAQDVTVREMQSSDWEAVRRIHAEGIATGHATFQAEPPTTFDAFAAGKPAGALFVAERGPESRGAVAGWVSLSSVSDRCVYAGVAETSVYVASEARGLRIGEALLRAVIERSEGAGIWTLQAGIFPENLSSLRLHERCGFVTVGVRRRLGLMTYGPLAGRWRDVVLLERRSDTVGVDSSEPSVQGTPRCTATSGTSS